MTLLDATEKLRRDRSLIEALIDDPSRLGPDFQPIKALGTDEVVGWKATGSGQAGTELDSTLALLHSAQAIGLVERLDWAFRVLALEAFQAGGLEAEMYITPEPETYTSPCPPRLAAAFARGRRAVKVVAEVPADSVVAGGSLGEAVLEFRGWGWRIVAGDLADEVAADAKVLDTLDRLRPDIVKLELGRLGRSPAGTSAGVRELLRWATGAGVEVMAIGVDTPELRQAAMDLGAVTGRGRLLGPPGRLPDRTE